MKRIGQYIQANNVGLVLAYEDKTWVATLYTYDDEIKARITGPTMEVVLDALEELIK